MKSYRLLVRPEAEFDLAAAYRWYEDKDAGLGEEFLRTVEASLLGIQKDPQTHQKIYKEIRRALTKRFPYGIFSSIMTRFPSLVFCTRDAIRL
jgi:hypothetical protein